MSEPLSPEKALAFLLAADYIAGPGSAVQVDHEKLGRGLYEKFMRPFRQKVSPELWNEEKARRELLEHLEAGRLNEPPPELQNGLGILIWKSSVSVLGLAAAGLYTRAGFEFDRIITESMAHALNQRAKVAVEGALVAHAKALQSVSAGGVARAEAFAAKAEKWQTRAIELWSVNPRLSVRRAAAIIASETGESPETIRRRISKP